MVGGPLLGAASEVKPGVAVEIFRSVRQPVNGLFNG